MRAVTWTFWNSRHSLARITRTTRTLLRVLALLARQVACHGVNRLSCKCHSVDASHWRATKMARLGTPYCGALRERSSCQCQACYSSDCEHAVEPSTIIPHSIRYSLRVATCTSILIGLRRVVHHLLTYLLTYWPCDVDFGPI